MDKCDFYQFAFLMQKDLPKEALLFQQNTFLFYRRPFAKYWYKQMLEEKQMETEIWILIQIKLIMN